jgi:hypothetical protein
MIRKRLHVEEQRVSGCVQLSFAKADVIGLRPVVCVAVLFVVEQNRRQVTIFVNT